MRESAAIIIVMLTAFLGSLLPACSSRYETPVYSDDSSLIYPPKGSDEITATISLYNKSNIKTGERIGEGSVFELDEGAHIYSSIELHNCHFRINKNLMLHIDWIDEDGKSFYKKRLDIPNSDSSAIVKSSISLSPENRQTGTYTIQVYLFRELIAEKKFKVLPEFKISPFMVNVMKVNINLYRYKSKKTGKLIGEGTNFKIKEKGKLRAALTLENSFDYGKRKIEMRLNWIAPDGSAFFKKKFEISGDDTLTNIYSSISLSPEKREPGEYSLRIYLFDELIEEKSFSLQLEKK